MSQAESRLYGAAASRAIDARVIQELRVTGFELMQRAARFAFDRLVHQYPQAHRLLALTGKGNNAGDAWLVAALARDFGLSARVLTLVAPDTLEGDAALARDRAFAARVPVAAFEPGMALEADVLLDGLLGTGARGAPRPLYADAIQAINRSGVPVLSIDLPSGVDADTGSVATVAVHADLTVSFITRKIGLHTGAGRTHSRTQAFSDLGAPAQAYRDPGVARLRWRPEDLGVVPDDAYKHRQGHVIVAGGGTGMPGAVAMAAEAALRAGAGMVTVATRPEHAAVVVGRTPEVMLVDAEQAGPRFARADLIVMGPGLGREPWGEALYDRVQASLKPVLVDADGLYWLAQRGAWQGGRLFITPHAAEAAALLGCKVADIQRDRPGAAGKLRERFSADVVLKGPGSVVATAAGLAICEHGNPGMATAGMGDVLSGVAGGLLAGVLRESGADTRADDGVDDGVDNDADAGRVFAAAVALHSAAADHAARQVGQRSLMATDVTAALPHMWVL